MKRSFPLHIHITTLFLILILLVGGVIGGLGYRISRDILESTAQQLQARIDREVLGEFIALLGTAEMATRIVSFDGITQATSHQERLGYLGFLREALNSSPALTSLYAAYGNGDFFLVRRLWNDADRSLFSAPDGTHYIVQSIERSASGASSRFLYLDASLAILRREERPDYARGYDPRTRDWYKAAVAARGQIKTPPYLFHTTRKVGITIANRAAKADAVVGADLRLETLDASLARQKVTPGMHLVLASSQGDTILFEDFTKSIRMPAQPGGAPTLARIGELGIPVLARLEPAVLQADGQSVKELSLDVDGETWRASIRPFRLEGTKTLFLVTAIPDKELMATAHQLIRQLLLAIALVILLAVPVTLALARSISRDLRKVAGEADAIRHFEFAQPIEIESMVLEVNALATTMDGMKRTIRRFLEISMAVAGEKDFDRLLHRLLAETMSAADADAAVLYLADDEMLVPALALGPDGSPTAAGNPANAAAAGPLLQGALAARSARAGLLAGVDVAGLGLAGLAASCGAQHAIAVPLANRQNALVGVILLLRRSATDAARLSFIEALSGSSAVSLESKELIRAQKMLFEAFIQLIAAAIDAKSPYTGGHCARVPELTKMLARAACAETGGPYKDFQLDEDEWESLHIAAWLHDCGKVTTPEYVVDKATKLETLYDRIHEIRMRFEVLKRDAEIACLKAIAAGEAESSARARLAQAQAQLDDDYAFIAACNVGGEFMTPEHLERLQAIASRTWSRTLDDRIGISHEEKARKSRTPAPSLPVAEPLLADKPEHRIERGARDVMAADNKWGFRMAVPALLYNKGELYNLSVARGTLSEEERYKINEHIVQTLIMLTQLPFPRHLRNVPEIAAGHHEKMDGSGYPKRLRKEEMSPVARMMAIADIFEALTAVDRPYKQGKTLSEAVGIMAMMKRDRHIDPELFDLFLRSGVYREYAERYLQPGQIDEVDISACLDAPSDGARTGHAEGPAG